jgi:hypothetical protein
MGIGYYKQLDNGDPNDLGDTSVYAWCTFLKENGIEPIIRMYQHRQFPKALPGHVFEKMKRYAERGITLVEIGNEPNLDNEWEEEHSGYLTWQSSSGYIADLVHIWIMDAIRTAIAGMRPALYAMAPTDWGVGRPHPRLSSVMFYNRFFQGVVDDEDADHFIDLFEDHGAWMAVHSSPYEFPFEFDPWQEPGRPWDMCLRGYEIPARAIKNWLGLEPEIISTESGVFCFDSDSMFGHERLVDHFEHATETVNMFAWLQDNSPLEAMCPWLLCNVNEYVAVGRGRVVQAQGWRHLPTSRGRLHEADSIRRKQMSEASRLVRKAITARRRKRIKEDANTQKKRQLIQQLKGLQRKANQLQSTLHSLQGDIETVFGWQVSGELDSAMDHANMLSDALYDGTKALK